MVRISFLTCVFLVGLRLVIGWHFFFEGVNKFESTRNEGAETYKPFNAAGYFAEAEGPLGPKMREFLGDPDQVALAKLKLQEGGEDDAARMPAPLAKEWDDYARQFADFYKLSDEEKKKAEEALKKAKADYVLWLTDRLDPKDKKKDDDDGADPSKKWTFGATVGFPGLIYRPEADVQQRVFAYQQFIQKVREDYEKVLRTMGNDVEKTRLRALKTATADIRRDLMKDVDSRTKKMKDSLAKVVGPRLAGYDVGKTDAPDVDDKIISMITPTGKGDEATADRMPPALGEQWDKYVETLKANHKDAVSPRADEIVRDAKLRYVRYLENRDPFTGDKLPAPEAAQERIYLREFEDAVAKYEATVREAVNSKGEPKPTLVQVGFLSLTIPKYNPDPKVAEQVAGERAASFLRGPTAAIRTSLYQDAVERLKSAREAKQKEPTPKNEAIVLAMGRLVEVPRQDFIDDIKLHTDMLRYNLGGLKVEKDADQFKGTVEQPVATARFLGLSWPTSNLEWLNSVTRWTLLIAGGCMLIGLFTRLACFTCAVFLINELLSNPALPWLPTSPKMEGNYLYVNKNVIELFALFVLITLPTGRWLGLDALLHAIFGRRKKSTV